MIKRKSKGRIKLHMKKQGLVKLSSLSRPIKSSSSTVSPATLVFFTKVHMKNIERPMIVKQNGRAKNNLNRVKKHFLNNKWLQLKMLK